MNELGLSSALIHQFLQQLLSEGELRKNEYSRFVRGEKHLMVADPSSLSMRQKKFIQEGLQENLTIFDKRYQEGTAKFLSLLTTAQANTLDEIFDSLRGSLEDVVRIIDPEKSQELGVYRIQLQAYRYKKNTK